MKDPLNCMVCDMKSRLLSLCKYAKLKFERPAMQTWSELVYQQDARMGEKEHGTLTDFSSDCIYQLVFSLTTVF